MKLQAWLVPTLLAFGVPLATHAQSSPSRSLADQVDDDDPVYLSPFEVSSDRVSGYRSTESGAFRFRRDLIDTPQSITVITNDFIRDIGASSIIDATQYVSGVSHGALAGPNGIFNRQVLRGFEIYHGTVDGIGGSAANVDPDIVERIEILKGPNALIEPSGSPGGASNIITKSPKFESAQVVKAEFASKYFGSKGVVDSTGPIPGTEHFAYRLIGTYQDASSFVPGRIFNKTLNPMLTWAITPKAQLKLKGQFFNWRQVGSVAANQHNIHFRDDLPQGATVSLADIKPGYKYGGANGQPEWNERAMKIRRGLAEFTTALNDNINLRLAHLRLYYHYYGNGGGLFQAYDNMFGLNRRDPHTGFYTHSEHWQRLDPNLPYDEASNPYISTPVDQTIYGAWLNEGFNHVWSQQTHYQADLTGKWSFGSFGGAPMATLSILTGASRSADWAHLKGWTKPDDMIVGWDFNKTVYTPTATLPAFDYDLTNPPQYINNVPRPRTAPFLSSESKNPRVYQDQIYINGQLDILQGKLIITGGVSHQRRDAPGGINLLTGNIGGSLKGTKNSPSFAALYKVTPWSSLYVHHSENATSTTYFDGNVDTVLWQDGKQEELGLKLDFFDRRLSFTTAYYELKQTNVATQHPNRWFDPTLPDQLADITNEGFEFDIIGQVTQNLTILASYTDMKMRDQLGRQRMGIADRFYNGLVKYAFPTGTAKGLSVFVGFNHVGKHAGENPPDRTPLGVVVPVSFYMPSRTIFNGGASYEYGLARFQINVENLFNKKTLWQPGGRNELTAFPGTNIRLTTTFTF
ncbi:TonB-dependent siderophore receptor [Cephaloticoccus primus]|uniref:TonB-dependent siderophore receptor n=1 Tax=Cephaloticoccus primus TaxID=1548207 RepID=UPI0009EF42BE|nr:TonB-dependent receptor plug domain-containing protein [Cephaloticoccus primus]